MASAPPDDSGHPDMDYAEHERTFALFTGLVKWGSVACIAAIILLGVMTL